MRKLTEREFIVTVLFNVAVVAAALDKVLSPKWAAIASAVSVAAFNVSRGLAKQPGAPVVTPVVTPTPTTPPTN